MSDDDSKQLEKILNAERLEDLLSDDEDGGGDVTAESAENAEASEESALRKLEGSGTFGQLGTPESGGESGGAAPILGASGTSVAASVSGGDPEHEAKVAARRQTLARVTAIRVRLAEIGDPESGRRAANERACDLRAQRDATVKRLDKELGEAEQKIRSEQTRYVALLDEQNGLKKELAELEPLLAQRP